MFSKFGINFSKKLNIYSNPVATQGSPFAGLLRLLTRHDYHQQLIQLLKLILD